MLIPFWCVLFLTTACHLNLNSDDGDNNGGGAEPDSSSVFQYADNKLPTSVLSGTTNSARAVDIDNDNDLDIVLSLKAATNKILYNNGEAEFTFQKVGTQSTNSRDAVIRYFNNDEYLDLFFANTSNQRSELYLQDARGNFDDLSNRTAVNGNFNAVFSFDPDQDGDSDLLIGSDQQNILLQNTGNAFFNDQSVQRLPQQQRNTQDFAVGDITGDKRNDIVVANTNANNILVDTGSGYYSSRPQRYPFLSQTEESRDIELVDVDGDGDLDLYIANSNFQNDAAGQDRLLINNNGRLVDETASHLPDLSFSTFDAEFADLDGDNDPDLVVGNYNGGLLVLINDGSGVFSDESDRWVPDNFYSRIMDITIGDYNIDGNFDIYLGVREGTDQLLLQ